MRTCLASLALVITGCSSPSEQVEPPDASSAMVDAAASADASMQGKVCGGVPAVLTNPATGCASSSCAACPVPATATGAVCSAGGACDFTCAPGDLKTATGCGPIARQITAGNAFTCALTRAQTVRCWGSWVTTTTNVPVTIPGLSQVTAIAAGDYHACALTAAGGVKCWGRGTDGQLGNGGLADSETPVDVTGLASGVVALTAGSRHTCAQLATGQVACWGDNGLLQLGVATPASSPTPVTIAGSNAVSIAAGAFHTCLVDPNHHVTCWGNGEAGQLGNGTKPRSTLGVEVSGLTDAVSIAAGGAGLDGYTCAIRAQGKVSCWGSNFWGYLGIGTNNADVTTPAELTGLTGVTELSLGVDATCAVHGAGALSCWGHGDYGKIGKKGWMAPNGYHWLPLPTAMPELAMPAIHAAVGQIHSCFITDTQVRCVGAAGSGQLGDGVSTEATDVPVVVAW